MVTNPIIGFVKHPWVAQPGAESASFPMKDPKYTYAQIRDAVRRTLPGALIHRQLGFRHTIEWTRPALP